MLPDNRFTRFLAEWPALYQGNVQKTLDVTRAYFETATKLQSEYSRFIQEQMATANENFIGIQQEFSQVASSGGRTGSVIKHAVEPAEHKPRKAA